MAQQQLLEAALGQQGHVFGEHAEQAAREEGGDTLRRVLTMRARGFERSRERGEFVRDFARDLRADASRVERLRVEPELAQALADRLAVQVGQRDAVRARVGERRVGGAAAAELGVELDHVADIDDDEKRRPPFRSRQRAGVALGLRAGAQERVVEAFGVRACTHFLGFEHEASALVAVDEAVALRAVAVRELHAALEHVGVVAGVVARRVGLGHAEQIAELTDEELVVGALGAGGGVPSGDESVDDGRAGGVGHGGDHRAGAQRLGARWRSTALARQLTFRDRFLASILLFGENRHRTLRIARKPQSIR